MELVHCGVIGMQTYSPSELDLLHKVLTAYLLQLSRERDSC